VQRNCIYNSDDEFLFLVELFVTMLVNIVTLQQNGYRYSHVTFRVGLEGQQLVPLNLQIL